MGILEAPLRQAPPAGALSSALLTAPSANRAPSLPTTGFANDRRIDYVFVDPRRFKIWDVGLIPYAHWEASDHLGYYARISLMP